MGRERKKKRGGTGGREGHLPSIGHCSNLDALRKIGVHMEVGSQPTSLQTEKYNISPLLCNQRYQYLFRILGVHI